MPQEVMNTEMSRLLEQYKRAGPSKLYHRVFCHTWM